MFTHKIFETPKFSFSLVITQLIIFLTTQNKKRDLFVCFVYFENCFEIYNIEPLFTRVCFTNFDEVHFRKHPLSLICLLYQAGGKLETVLNEYASRLASQGCLQSALNTLEGIQHTELRDRLMHALGMVQQQRRTSHVSLCFCYICAFLDNDFNTHLNRVKFTLQFQLFQ